MAFVVKDENLFLWPHLVHPSHGSTRDAVARCQGCVLYLLLWFYPRLSFFLVATAVAVGEAMIRSELQATKIMNIVMMLLLLGVLVCLVLANREHHALVTICVELQRQVDSCRENYRKDMLQHAREQEAVSLTAGGEP